MISLNESMGPGRDQTRDPWICSQTLICCQTRYRLRYAARSKISPDLDPRCLTLIVFLKYVWRPKNCCLNQMDQLDSHTVKPVLSDHSKNRQNKDLNDKWYNNEGRKYCRMLPLGSILQHFWPASSHNWSWNPIFGLFESGRFRQLLL